MLPSNSAFGTRAATESTMMTPNRLDRISLRAMLSASSPVVGCEIATRFRSTPQRTAYSGSSACSTSM